MGTSQELSAQAAYDAFWQNATDEIRRLDLAGLKHQELPLARIKKVITLLYFRMTLLFTYFSYFRS
jgi:hypothetical protein